PVWRSLPMVGSATLTMVPSSIAIELARIVAASAIFPGLDWRRKVPGATSASREPGWSLLQERAEALRRVLARAQAEVAPGLDVDVVGHRGALGRQEVGLQRPQRAGRRPQQAVDDGVHLRGELGVVVHPADDAEPERLVGVELRRQEAELAGLGRTDDAGQR